jgi:hypothetical protein
MKEEDRVFMRYLMFTVPHATVFAGALFGILLVLRIRLELAVAVFSLTYGVVLTILALLVRDHFSKSTLYRLFLSTGLLFLLGGASILLFGR